jgi:hypothetical protein
MVEDAFILYMHRLFEDNAIKIVRLCIKRYFYAADIIGVRNKDFDKMLAIRIDDPINIKPLRLFWDDLCTDYEKSTRNMDFIKGSEEGRFRQFLSNFIPSLIEENPDFVYTVLVACKMIETFGSSDEAEVHLLNFIPYDFLKFE